MELDFTAATEVFYGQRQVDEVYFGTIKLWPIASGPKTWDFNPEQSTHRPLNSAGPVNAVRTGDIIRFTLAHDYDGVAVGIVRLDSNLHGVAGGNIDSVLQRVKGPQSIQVNVSPGYGPYVPWTVFRGPGTWEFRVIGNWSNELIFAYLYDVALPEFDPADQIPFAARHA
jgi:hypothetical protein